MNVKLVIAYDGGDFFGWQKTSAKPTVEETLQDCLERLLQHPVILQAASRTDRGVHATGQVVNFFTDKPLDHLDFRLNRLLPSSLQVRSMEQMPDIFHPTLDNHGKIYTYALQTTAVSPLERHRIWHFPYSIDMKMMQTAARKLIGTHDFAAFTNVSPSKPRNTVRTIYSIDIEETNQNRYQFTICGKEFLYKMVRNLCGTLAYIGCGKLPARAIDKLLKHGDRTQAGATAPACGLILKEVLYTDPGTRLSNC